MLTPQRFRWVTLVVALFAFVEATPREARADGAPIAERRVIDVVIAATPEDAAQVKDSLGELLHRVGLETRVTVTDRIPAEHDRGAPSADVLVRVWIDLRADDIATIELADARAERPLLRRSVPREGSRAVLFEEVAHVVQAATESVIADTNSPRAPASDAGAQSIAAPPTESRPAPAERPTEIPAVRAAWSVALAPFVAGGSYGRGDDLVFGAGVGGRLDRGHGAWRPALWLLGEYRPPFGNHTEPVAIRASVWSLRALPALQLFYTPRVLVEIAAGGGVDVLTISPGPSASGARIERDAAQASLIFTGALIAHVSLTQSLRVFVLAAIDGDATPRRYVVVAGSTRTTLLEPMAIRPGIALGFSFDVAGSRGTP